MVREINTRPEMRETEARRRELAEVAPAIKPEVYGSGVDAILDRQLQELVDNHKPSGSGELNKGTLMDPKAGEAIDEGWVDVGDTTTEVSLNTQYPEPVEQEPIRMDASRSETDLDMKLHEVTAEKSLSEIRDLLQQGANPNTLSAQGTLPLCEHARRGNLDAVKLLLDHEADVNLSDASGRTAISYAAETTNPQMARLLMAAPGIDVNFKDGELRAPVCVKIIESLLKEAHCPQQNLNDEEQKILEDIIEGSYTDLKRLKQILDDCKELKQPLEKKRWDKAKLLQFLQRVQLDPKVINSIQSSLSLKITLLNTSRTHQTARMQSFVSSNLDLQKEIKNIIGMKVDGMFLLARLLIDAWSNKLNPKELKKALKVFGATDGKGNVYSAVYDEAMKRIESQPSEHIELAQNILSWITGAMRPLKVVELQHALAIEEDEAEIDQDNITPVETMLSIRLDAGTAMSDAIYP
ncbi:uncharacterized protein N0V96_010453 [Colletotrichum fioriniae]|uniref:uncharacterized protein n=1 Tax=Colletotrichum fioriniae TaxID=710243 RepID=UPI0032DAB3C3|nr:hypothetical protein N0V96_010453 [Colletotrichum fioriniae]